MTDADVLRVAFVARRYRQLQGLRVASLGLGLIAGVIVWSATPVALRALTTLLGPALMLFAGCTGALDVFYDRQFGRFVLPHRRWIWFESIGPIQLGLTIDMLRGIVALPGPSGTAVALTLSSLWLVIRDRPWRMHYQVGVLAGLAAIVITASSPSLPPFGEAQFGEAHMSPAAQGAYALAFALVGLAVFVTGLADHFFLWRSMAGPREGYGIRNIASEYRLPRAAISSLFLGLAILVLVADRTAPSLASLLAIVMSGIGFAGVQMIMATNHLQRVNPMLAPWERRPVPDTPHVPVAPPDVLGHFILPVAMAAGALADLRLIGTGFPSALALSLALSHLRIETRDWPVRKHYLGGVAAALVMAGAFTLVRAADQVFWLASFGVVIFSVMTIEGLLDRRRPAEAGHYGAVDTTERSG